MAIINKYKLSDWEHYYAGERKIHMRPKTGWFTSYDIFLCDSIITSHIPKAPKNREKRIMEIGSGDGKLVKKIAGMLGMTPFGIEYAREGAKQGEKNGVTTMVADAFSQKVLDRYRHRFDVVFSYGFIEHIHPVEKAIRLHIDLVKRGGYVVIQIPRLKGFNYWKFRFFRPDVIPLHNLSIMEGSILKQLCEKEGLTTVYCSNYGTLKLRLPIDRKDFRYYLLKIICLLEYVTNPLFRMLFGDRGFETSVFSPAVMYIGRKS